MEIILALVGIGLIALLARKDTDGEGEVTEPPDPPPPVEKTPATPTEPAPVKEGDRDDSGGTLGSLIGDLKGKVEELIPATPAPPKGDPAPVEPIPPQEPDPPGTTPGNPLPSSELYPGFVGYFRVMEGDTLTKLAKKITGSGTNWRAIRDDPQNEWAKEQCSKSVKDTYYGGESGIDLIANYVDPGWETQLKHTVPLTGIFPVLHFGG